MIRPKIESLEFVDLSYSTPDGKKLLDSVQFRFPQSGLFWLRSQSGEGKSTLLRILDGLLEPSEGQYLVNGMNVMNMTFTEFTPFRLQFGLSFDFGGLIHNRSLKQNLSLILEYHKLFGDEESQEKVSQYLENFGIKEFADARPSSVPGAVRKVICVARAFIHEPQVLLLDDPSTGLRKEARRSFLETVGRVQVKSDKLILVATEDLDLVKELDVDGEIRIHDKKLDIEMNSKRRQVA